MAEITADFIEERNKKFLESLQGNVGKYLSFLSTMARFHKYEVADLTSFAIEAPTMFTAVASKELWEKHFQRKINSNAKGVTLIKDGKKIVYYDVSETESTAQNEVEVKLWQYDNSVHKKFLDAVVENETSAEKQIQLIAAELANRSDIGEKSKKLLALSVESVILERMGFSTENATRQLAKISFKEQDVQKILEETQATAKIFLDAMKKSVMQKSTENFNPLLQAIGIVKPSEKIEKVQEPELNLTEQPIQKGLFDIDSDDENKQTVEENSSSADENVESAKILEIDDTLTAVGEISEIPESDNAVELVEENFENDEENVADYDFEEFDEEEEILPDISKNQNKVEILPENDSQTETEQVENIVGENDSEQISEVEENSAVETATATSEISTPDLQTVLAEDMAVVRGNNRDKNIFRKNITAIRTLQFIEKEKRDATPEEIEVLKKYAGFGGIPKAFDKNDPNWNREAWLLQSMLTDKEYSDARGSTLNAHYTSGEIVHGIYDGLQNLGFNQGTILEPSMGVGGFFGNMPDEMKNGSHLFGVELDSITGRIAQKIICKL